MKGTRRIFTDGEPIEYVVRNIIDAGSTHSFKVGATDCVLQIGTANTTFTYKFTVAGMIHNDYIQQFWTKALKWRLFNGITAKWHQCVAYRPSESSNVCVFFDGKPARFESDFIDGGSKHQFFVTKSGLTSLYEYSQTSRSSKDKNREKVGSGSRPNMHCVILLEEKAISLLVDDRLYPPVADPLEDEEGSNSAARVRTVKSRPR